MIDAMEVLLINNHLAPEDDGREGSREGGTEAKFKFRILLQYAARR